MKATIETPVSERAPQERSLTIWAQRETIPFMIAVRKVLNDEYITSTSFASTLSGWQTAWTSDPIPTNRAWTVNVSISAISTSGANQSAAFSILSLFTNVGGVVSKIGSSTVHSILSDVTIDARVVVSGSAIIVQVQDNGVSPMLWKIRVEILFTDEQ